MKTKKYDIETLKLDNMLIDEIVQLDSTDVYRHCEEPIAWRYPCGYRYSGEDITIEVKTNWD